jgi:hypothetical protein
MELSTFGCAFLGILVLSPQNSELRLCFGQSPRDLILALTHMCCASIQTDKLVERTKKNKYDRRKEQPTYERHASSGPCGGRNGRRDQKFRTEPATPPRDIPLVTLYKAGLAWLVGH